MFGLHVVYLNEIFLSQSLAVSRATSSRLDLTTEEYLHSLISMINDFSRLAVNAVTMADFATPLRLSEFVKDLYAGFGMLNLKNDSLRKRFDSIKVSPSRMALTSPAGLFILDSLPLGFSLPAVRCQEDRGGGIRHQLARPLERQVSRMGNQGTRRRGGRSNQRTSIPAIDHRDGALNPGDS